jgi:hypothetical protein
MQQMLHAFEDHSTGEPRLAGGRQGAITIWDPEAPVVLRRFLLEGTIARSMVTYTVEVSLELWTDVFPECALGITPQGG